LWKLDYTHVFGLLRSQKDKPKYIYLHRLGIPVPRWRLTIGVNEATVTGSTTDQVLSDTVYYEPQSRDWEWVYMIPFVPFSFAEHYIGDRDNSCVSFDLNLLQPRGFRWYAELFLDDITAPWTLFSDDWGNKWALTAGCEYHGVLLGRDITAALEYSRVEPWVYTHFYGGSHRYTHFGECLGAPGGPNADVLWVGMDAAVTPRNTVGLAVVNRRKNTNRGGNVSDVFQDTTDGYAPTFADSESKTFLGTGTERATQIDLMWRLMPLGRIRAEAHIIYETGTRGDRLLGSAGIGFFL
jgi:hypothetical protein